MTVRTERNQVGNRVGAIILTDGMQWYQVMNVDKVPARITVILLKAETTSLTAVA